MLCILTVEDRIIEKLSVFKNTKRGFFKPLFCYHIKNDIIKKEKYTQKQFCYYTKVGGNNFYD